METEQTVSMQLTLEQIKFRNHYFFSIRDPLTGLYDRGYFEEMFQRKLEETLQNNLPLAVMIIEIDHFKRYNNIYGPQAGDRVLKALSKFLKDSTRRIKDIVCRYGEDKFTLFLTGASLSAVLHREEDLRERFKKIQETFDNQIFEEVSFSIGIAAFPENGSTKETLLQEAETNLLLNKDMKQREDLYDLNFHPI